MDYYSWVSGCAADRTTEVPFKIGVGECKKIQQFPGQIAIDPGAQPNQWPVKNKGTQATNKCRHILSCARAPWATESPPVPRQ